ncbi:MAG: UDP-glucose 4-epimerase GalE [Candidatus Gracilibacteria bacterium]|nr:UDP-glucose 4-epimerase GalE [Candidatus Gracilibacteria bacterium]
MKKTILLTGGLGYIGSHTCVVLEQAGFRTVLLDNLSNSSLSSLDGIERILGYRPVFYDADIRDRGAMASLLKSNDFAGVIHFAGLKAVGESVESPFEYYNNNIQGSFVFFEEMERTGLRNIVFSSSATVYAADNTLPLTEASKLGTTNSYGTSKLTLEFVLRDLVSAKAWNAIALRYFNPIGAHASGYIGERPKGVPNNLLPYILDVAIGKRERVGVYGDDYDTVDGTGVRDYIDVNDLAEAHLAAIQKLLASPTTPLPVFSPSPPAPLLSEEMGAKSSFQAINIGTGQGTSVLEMIENVRLASGKSIPYAILARRPGDLGSVYADPSLARELLGWEVKRSVREAVGSSWKFVHDNR